MHKARYLVIGYGGNYLVPISEPEIAAGRKDLSLKIKQLKGLPEIRNIHVEPVRGSGLKELIEHSVWTDYPETIQALHRDRPDIVEVVKVGHHGEFKLPKYGKAR